MNAVMALGEIKNKAAIPYLKNAYRAETNPFIKNAIENSLLILGLSSAEIRDIEKSTATVTTPPLLKKQPKTKKSMPKK
jgi:HEAT repeat protein